jgi:exodeoxyribonuclease V alpha subunit
MLDLPLLYRVLRRLPEGCRLLLVGDPYQLPPIQFGLSFHILMDSPTVPSVELTQVHRQTEVTGIPKVAADIRFGRRPALAVYSGIRPGVSFIDCAEANVLDLLTEVVEDFGGFDDVQILSAIKAGIAGVNAINTHFHRLMAVGRDRLPWHDLAVGDPVMFTRNDYQRELFNGSLGHLRRVDGTYDATAAFDGTEHRLDRADLDALALAYCITVHKAQGSQFRRVVIPVLPSRLLDRTLLYTAVTRAVEQVVLLGDRAAFERAVAAPAAPMLRDTGLAALMV